MTKRLVDIDDEALGEAQSALGTANMKDTVNTALRAVVDKSEDAKTVAWRKLTEMARNGDFDILLDKRNYRR